MSKIGTSPVAQTVKHLPTKKETQVRSLSEEDPLEEGVATHSNILAWRIPWTEQTGRLQSMGSQRVGHDYRGSSSSRSRMVSKGNKAFTPTVSSVFQEG